MIWYERFTKSKYCYRKKAKAFTLAEVLVVLAAIGVISVLVMPQVVNSYQTKSWGTRAKKLNLELKNSLDLYLTDKGKVSLVSTDIKNSSGVKDFLTKYLRVSGKDCGNKPVTNGCFAENYIKNKADGTTEAYPNSGMECVKLQTAAVVCMSPMDASKKIKFFIDLNSTSKPNLLGADVYEFTYEEPEIEEEIAEAIPTPTPDPEPEPDPPAPEYEYYLIQPSYGIDCTNSANAEYCHGFFRNDNDQFAAAIKECRAMGMKMTDGENGRSKIAQIKGGLPDYPYLQINMAQGSGSDSSDLFAVNNGVITSYSGGNREALVPGDNSNYYGYDYKYYLCEKKL